MSPVADLTAEKFNQAVKSMLIALRIIDSVEQEKFRHPTRN
jgi:hypothetical protein